MDNMTVIKNEKRGIRWDLHVRSDDLDYADDVCLLSQLYIDMSPKICSVNEIPLVTFHLSLLYFGFHQLKHVSFRDLITMSTP
jgi:hypothetical protein